MLITNRSYLLNCLRDSVSCKPLFMPKTGKNKTGKSFMADVLTLARTGGGGADATSHEFFRNGRRTARRIALKFCIAYGASFA